MRLFSLFAAFTLVVADTVAFVFPCGVRVRPLEKRTGHVRFPPPWSPAHAKSPSQRTGIRADLDLPKASTASGVAKLAFVVVIATSPIIGGDVELSDPVLVKVFSVVLMTACACLQKKPRPMLRRLGRLTAGLGVVGFFLSATVSIVASCRHVAKAHQLSALSMLLGFYCLLASRGSADETNSEATR